MMSHFQRGCVLAATLATFLTPPAAFGGNVPYLVKDIKPGPPGSSPTSMTKVGNRLFFNAHDGVHGQELWVSDGTQAGTYMVIDLVPGSDGSVPQWWMADLNGIAIFYADNNDDGFDLYRSDGTAQGTMWIGEVTDGDDPIPEGSCTFSFYYFEEAGGLAYFMGKNSTNQEALWKTDGTLKETVKLKDVNINELKFIDSILYFVASGPGQSIPGFDLWKSDGTVDGTVRLKDLSGAIWLTESKGRLFFQGQASGDDEELWISNGTAEGTMLVKDINPGPNPSTPVELTDVNGTMFFTAYSPASGREIWMSDGSEVGTQMLIDLVPGASSGGAYGLTNVDGTLFFARFDAVQGWQLWKSDGTAEGTVVVKIIAPPTVPSKTRPDLFAAVNGKLYFRADDGEHGLELWMSNGLDWGTRMIADSRPGPAHHAPGELQAVGPIIFYGAGDGVTGNELWAFDTREPVIPTLSTIGITILALVLILAGTFVLRRADARNSHSDVSLKGQS